jgi:hypothetical protein
VLLHRSLTEDLVEILAGFSLSKRSLHENLAHAMSYRCLCDRKTLGRFLYQDLVRPATAAAGPFMTIL